MSSERSKLGLTSEMVVEILSRAKVSPTDVPDLIRGVYRSVSIESPAVAESVEASKPPAVSIRKSITPDYLVCLEDGQRFKLLKRYLRSRYGLTPEAYRHKWGLPADYPMVAPNYAERLSKLALTSGLGKTDKAPARKALKRKA